MKNFIIERNLTGAGNLIAAELQHISQASCEVAVRLGVPYHCIESFFTENKIYCIHMAESEAVIRQHAKLAMLPINTVAEVKSMINPVPSCFIY
jgi:hypothetical protein